MRPFFVLSLPRSGSAWLSNFLTWGQSFCYHEVSFGCEGLDDIRLAFERAGTPVVGAADTAGILYCHAIQQWFPGAKIAVIVRDHLDVTQSLHNCGFQNMQDNVTEMAGHLHWAIGNLDPFVMKFDNLFSGTTQRDLWEFLEMPDPFPWQRFEMLREVRMDDHRRFFADDSTTELADPGMVRRFNSLLRGLPPRMASIGFH